MLVDATEEDYCIPDNGNKKFQEFQEYVRLDDIKLVESSGLVLRRSAPWSLSSHSAEKPCCGEAFIAQGMFRNGKIQTHIFGGTRFEYLLTYILNYSMEQSTS